MCPVLVFVQSILKGLVRFIGRIASREEFWWIAGITAVLVIGALLSWRFWEELGHDEESLSTTVRNLGIVIAGVIALPLAIWRSIVAQRQASTAQQDLLNQRYQQGAEMLGSEVLTVRLGGIYVLQRLAEEHPKQYHVQIMRLLCAFVRHPITGKRDDIMIDAGETPHRREDVQAVMTAISACHPKQVKLEKDVKYRLGLTGAVLSGVVLRDGNLSDARLGGAVLSGAKLSGAILSGTLLLGADLSNALLGRANLSSAILRDANLSNASLKKADVSGAELSGADLSSARLQGANLSGVSLTGANLSDANFSKELVLSIDFTASDGDPSSKKEEMLTTGLTQAQLDQACADLNTKPKLEGVLDGETGEPLVWRGEPCENRR